MKNLWSSLSIERGAGMICRGEQMCRDSVYLTGTWMIPTALKAAEIRVHKDACHHLRSMMYTRMDTQQRDTRIAPCLKPRMPLFSRTQQAGKRAAVVKRGRPSVIGEVGVWNKNRLGGVNSSDVGFRVLHRFFYIICVVLTGQNDP